MADLSMIERVAVAISGAPFPSKAALRKARAALQAMREPTDLMGALLPTDYQAGSHSAAQIWRAMIDGALVEGSSISDGRPEKEGRG